MTVQDLPIRTDQDNRVVKSPSAELAITLVDPDRYGGLQAPRGGLYRLPLGCLQIDRVLQQPRVDLAAQVVVVPRAHAPDPFGVAGYPRLGEGNELGAARRGFLQQLDPSREGLRPVEGRRRMLAHGDSVRARGFLWHGAMLQRRRALC